MRRRFGFMIAVVFWALSSLALASSPQEAEQTVKVTATKLLERLRADHDKLQANPKLIYPLVEDLVLPHFDFEKMSQWVLGRYWRQATPEQREQFTKQFRDLLVRTYATALLEYDRQTVRYLPVQAAADARRVTVKTEIVQSGSPPIPIDYRMYLNDGGWKVYDIAVDGVSLVTNYRSSFASQIRQGGMDQLIATLEKRNSQAQGK